MSMKIDRRDFLKMMGLGGAGAALGGCDLPSYVTLEEGEENVVSYLMPEEYVIPGVGVWYASTCTQCSAACGIHGRVREGRVLKLEGNPDSPINKGTLCATGQAGVQGHYNPDRVTQPMARQNGALTAVSWDEAQKLLSEKLGAVEGARFAWFTGMVSGHQAALLGNHLEAMGATRHYVHEVINNSVGDAVNRDMLGTAAPRMRIDKARMVLSLGADFLGSSSVSPLHFSGQYTTFRTNAPRGLLVQVESKMTLTGGNADWWLPIRPGSDGALALGLANQLLSKHGRSSELPDDVRQLVESYSLDKTSETTGISADRIEKLAGLLNERSPSLVLAGAPVQGQANGYAATAAIMLLNHILGNVGQTIEANGEFPLPQLAAKTGNTRSLMEFAAAAGSGELDAVIFYASNPVYSAPQALGLNDALGKIGYKIAISQFMDETAAQADLVLPLASYLEDWGTHVADYQPGQRSIHMQQPLMEPLHADTRGFGDLLLMLLKQRNNDVYGPFADYYAYLRNALVSLPAGLKGGAADDAFWNKTLQVGLIPVPAENASVTFKAVSFADPGAPTAGDGFTLLPMAHATLYDGRHANLPWLQEQPDPIVKVVWDSWVEIHPRAAAKLNIKQGDIVRVSSDQGAIEVKAVLNKAMHPEAVAIPLGQGHETYGRWASGVGANPLKILNPVTEAKTGELATCATRVTLARVGTDPIGIVTMGASDTQHGRRFVRTISAEQLRRTEGA